MKTIALVLQLLSYMPAIQGRPETPAPPAASGTGTLLISACRPGMRLTIEPGHLRGAVWEDGVARIPAPAQADGSDPYEIDADGVLIEMNGTLRARESLSAVCP